MSTRRERDDGYVNLNTWERRFNVSPELSGKSGFGIWSKFLHRDIFFKIRKDSQPSFPENLATVDRKITRVALSSKSLWVLLAPRLTPVQEEGKWEKEGMLSLRVVKWPLSKGS